MLYIISTSLAQPDRFPGDTRDYISTIPLKLQLFLTVTLLYIQSLLAARMGTLNLLLKLARRAHVRFASAQATGPVTSTGVRPFAEIPDVKMTLTSTAVLLLNLLRGKPPSLVSMGKSAKAKYGNIFNTSLGPVPCTTVLCPEDVEVVFRTDGKVPIREVMPLWADAMKSLGRDLTLFHRLVLCAGQSNLRRLAKQEVLCLPWTWISYPTGIKNAHIILRGVGISKGTLCC